MMLDGYGQIVRTEWFRTAQVRPYVRSHEYEFVVTPNHVHGIVWIVDDVHVGATRRLPPPDETRHPWGPESQSFGAIIAGFKSATTQHINPWCNASGAPLWQRDDYERIIHNY